MGTIKYLVATILIAQIVLRDHTDHIDIATTLWHYGGNICDIADVASVLSRW